MQVLRAGVSCAFDLEKHFAVHGSEVARGKMQLRQLALEPVGTRGPRGFRGVVPGSRPRFCCARFAQSDFPPGELRFFERTIEFTDIRRRPPGTMAGPNGEENCIRWRCGGSDLVARGAPSPGSRRSSRSRKGGCEPAPRVCNGAVRFGRG